MKRFIKSLLVKSGLRGQPTPAALPTPECTEEPLEVRMRDAGEFWSESESSARHQDLSHWRGIGRFEEQVWRNIGESHFALFEQLCCLAGTPPETMRTMVEWGQGGGANAIRFLQHFSDFYGVDISQPNLDECGRQLNEVGFTGFHPVLIPAEHPESCLPHIPPPIDFFLSVAVFQHFPSKSYGVDVLKIAHQLLANKGLAIVQIRYDNMTDKFAPKLKDYKKNAVTFTSYRLDEFWNICEETGFQPLFMTLRPKVNYAYFLLKKA
jgi:hypothetical protein